MATTVNEVYAARTVRVENGSPTAEREYFIHGVNTEQAALDAMLGSSLCPATMSVRYRDVDNNSVTETLNRTAYDIREEITGRSADDFTWRGTARYSIPTEADPGDDGGGSGGITVSRPPEVRWQFSTYTESSTATVALYGQRKYGRGPDVGDMLNVANREGLATPEGAPVLVPAGMLRGSKTYTASRWNTLVAAAKSSICRVNSSAFSAGGMSFAAGELLCVGAEVRPDSERNIEYEVQFLYSPNASGNTGGVSWSKNGWQYLWPYWVPSKDGKIKVVGVYVADVYPTTPFGGLFPS